MRANSVVPYIPIWPPLRTASQPIWAFISRIHARRSVRHDRRQAGAKGSVAAAFSEQSESVQEDIESFERNGL
jgi:hypothetical protein